MQPLYHNESVLFCMLERYQELQAYPSISLDKDRAFGLNEYRTTDLTNRDNQKLPMPRLRKSIQNMDGNRHVPPYFFLKAQILFSNELYIIVIVISSLQDRHKCIK